MERRGDGAGSPPDQPSLWGAHDPFEDTAPQPVIRVEAPAATASAAAGSEVPRPATAGTAAAPPPASGAPARRRGRAGWIAAGVAAVLVLGAGGAWALTRPSGSSTVGVGATSSPSGELAGAAPLPSTTAAGASTAPLPASQPTLVLGDSLALVAYPYLASMLPDRYVSYVAEVGRSTAKIATALEAEKSIPPVVIVSAGTNDQLAADVGPAAARIVTALGSQRCAVWVDVVRPDSYGDPAAQVNAAIDAAVTGHPNVTVLRWSEMVAAHPEYLAHDGIHPTEVGAKARAQAYADASKACSPFDPTAPKAKRQVLPDSIFWGPISGSDSNGSSNGSSSGNGSGNGSSNGSSSSKRSPSPSPQRSSASAKPSPAKTTPSPTAKPTTTPPPTPAATTDPGA